MVKYHQEYICDCNKYSADLSVKHKGEYVFTVTNTGTSPLCKDYILCGKYINVKNCEKYILLPGESMEIRYQGPRRKQMVSIYFQIDNDNWIKSNALTIYKDVQIFNNESRLESDITPDTYNGETYMTHYSANVLPGSFQLIIVNPNPFTVFNIVAEFVFQNNFILNFNMTPLYQGVTVIGDNTVNISNLVSNEKTSIDFTYNFNPSETYFEQGIAFNVLYSSPDMNIVYKRATRNTLFL